MIDTAEKRRSISGIFRLLPGVTPNASPGQAWRQESGWSYSGILAGLPAALTPRVCFYIDFITRVECRLDFQTRIVNYIDFETRVEAFYEFGCD